MKLGVHYMLDGHKIIETENWLTWARWFEKADRRVAWTARGRVQVSTVFLGLDHNFEGVGEPILFETMVFGSWWHDGYQRRYHTWEEAETGHKKTAKMVLGGWRVLVEIPMAELLHTWNSIPHLPVQESWADTLKWLFFIRSGRVMVCEHKSVRTLGNLEHLMLQDGHHTDFVVMQCECGRFIAFPDSNLQLAINEGTPETLRRLISVTWVRPDKEVPASPG